MDAAPPARRTARRLPPPVLDLALAVLVALLSAAELARSVPAGDPTTAADPWGLVLVAAASLPLALRRTRPRTVLGVVLGAAALLSLGGYRQSAFALGLVVAV